LRDNTNEVVNEEDQKFICGTVDYDSIEKLPAAYNKELLTMYEENESTNAHKRLVPPQHQQFAQFALFALTSTDEAGDQSGPQ
jgi:hypothetical protein